MQTQCYLFVECNDVVVAFNFRWNLNLDEETSQIGSILQLFLSTQQIIEDVRQQFFVTCYDRSPEPSSPKARRQSIQHNNKRQYHKNEEKRNMMRHQKRMIVCRKAFLVDALMITHDPISGGGWYLRMRNMSRILTTSSCGSHASRAEMFNCETDTEKERNRQLMPAFWWRTVQ